MPTNPDAPVPNAPGWKTHGRAGPFDWFVGCQQHDTASGVFMAWCLSCRFAADHNDKMRVQLEREAEYAKR